MTLLQAHFTSWLREDGDPPDVRLDAASPGLSADDLAAIGSLHGVFRIPPYRSGGSAAEPSHWPAVLSFRPVVGVGNVLSHTVGAGPESGGGTTADGGRRRFISHVLVDVTGDGFDGLLPVELWGAAHWVTHDWVPAPLPALWSLEAGPVDLASLSRLAGPRRALLGRVLDAALAALAGDGRVVIVESDIDAAIAWLAWVSLALPRELARRLTFSTFDGCPCATDAVDLCVTGLGSRVDIAAGGCLGAGVTVVDVERGDPGPVSLYGRVLGAMAEQGSEAIALLVRRLPQVSDRGGLAAHAALLAGRGDLVEEADVPAVLLAAVESLRAGGSCASASTLTALPDGVPGPAQLRAWGELHREARSATAPDAADLTDLALARLLARSGALPEIAALAMPASNAPTIERLAGWLDIVERATAPGALAAHCREGATLGLIGVNASLDRHLAAALAAAAEHPVVQRALADTVASYGGVALLELTTDLLSRRARTDAAAFGGLVAMSALEEVRARLEQLASGEHATFDDVAIWHRLRTREDPAQRGRGLVEMARRANDEAAHSATRAQLGPGGPRTVAAHSELLRAYQRGGVVVPPQDLRAARSAFERLDVWDDGAKTLGPVLEAVDPGIAGWLPWLAWDLLVRGRESATAYVSDGVLLANREGADGDLRGALALAVVRRAQRASDAPEAGELWERIITELPGAPGVVIERLRAELDEAEKPEAATARMFGVFHKVHPRSLDEVLPAVLEGSGRRVLARVGAELRAQGAPDATIDDWRGWKKTHLRPGLGGRVGRSARLRGAP